MGINKQDAINKLLLINTFSIRDLIGWAASRVCCNTWFFFLIVSGESDEEQRRPAVTAGTQTLSDTGTGTWYGSDTPRAQRASRDRNITEHRRSFTRQTWVGTSVSEGDRDLRFTFLQWQKQPHTHTYTSLTHTHTHTHTLSLTPHTHCRASLPSLSSSQSSDSDH